MRAASGGSSSFVISAADRVTRRKRAASRSWKIAPHVKAGISRMAIVSGKSTAELVSYPGVKSIRRSDTNSRLV